MTSNAFNAATTTSTVVGYNNYTATTASSGTINVLSDQGMMAISTASSTSAPSVSGSLQSTATIQYYITATNVANTITTSNGNDSITGGAVVDTINSGDGDDTIVGGLGGDIINVGAGIDQVFITVGDTAGTISSGNTTASHDKITGLGVGDSIATGLTMSAVTTQAAPGTTYGVNSAAVVIRGTFDPTANTAAGSFTNAVAGNDLYFVFDNDGTGVGTTFIGVVLVGAAANGITGLLMSAAGVATFV
jgi:Ca2+-binding RTX toxin-like protein